MWFDKLNDISDEVRNQRVATYCLSRDTFVDDIVKMIKDPQSKLAKEMCRVALQGETSLRWTIRNKTEFYYYDYDKIDELLKQKLPPNIKVTIGTSFSCADCFLFWRRYDDLHVSWSK